MQCRRCDSSDSRICRWNDCGCSADINTKDYEESFHDDACAFGYYRYGIIGFDNGALKYVADPDTELAEITHWQLGSLTKATWNDVAYIGPPILLAGIILITIRWRINILSLGEGEARTLGMDIRRIRGIVVVCATILTASAVCISGTIGWIGLVIPHLCRMMIGPDNRKVIPFSIVMGAIFALD